MTIKISRVNQNESYNITVDWLSDFAKNITKQAQIVEIHRHSGREKFATIEEKMKDIKARIGFEKADELRKESDLNKESSCECNTCEKCSIMDNNKKKLSAILKYIKQKISNRPGITYMQVIDDCRSLPEYQELSNMIYHDKLSQYIKDVISKTRKAPNSYTIEHIPHDESYQFDDDMRVSYTKND